MKFYIRKSQKYYLKIIRDKKLTAIYSDDIAVDFYKNGKFNNYKNAAYIDNNGYKSFYLNGNKYGDYYNFTKQSWRKFTKLQVFL